MHINVRFNGTIEDFAHHHPIFGKLKNAKIKKSESRCWNRVDASKKSYDVQAIFIGKTGYGKSSTVNSFIGKSIMDVSDTRSCTRDVQSFEFKISNDHYLSLADLPGIGESNDLDEKYLNLYMGIIKKTDVIVYLIRADSRDYSIDEIAFKRLFPTINLRKKVVLALNCCDKIEPINRNTPFHPTKIQMENIKSKIEAVSGIFKHPKNKIIPFCATEQWNINSLANEIFNVITLSPEITMTT